MTAVPVTLPSVTSLLTGRPALNARQMLLVNMLTDALPAAAVAVSPVGAPGSAGTELPSTSVEKPEEPPRPTARTR